MKMGLQCTITVRSADGTTERFDTIASFENALKERRYANVEITIVGVERIPDCLCANQTGIQSLILGEGVCAVGAGAFSGCTGIESISFASTVAGIGDYAFARNYSLKKIVCGKGVRLIGKGAFFGCTSLVSITLDKTIQSIGAVAFAFCPNLHDISAELRATCVIDKSAFHESLNDYVVCSQVGRLALQDIPGKNAFTPGSAGNRYYVEKINGWERKRLEKQLAYRGVSVGR